MNFQRQNDYFSDILMKMEPQEQKAGQQLQRGSKYPILAPWTIHEQGSKDTPTVATPCWKRKCINSDATMHRVPTKEEGKF